MTDRVTELAAQCAELNATVRECRKAGDLSLGEFIDLQADKVRANSRIRQLKEPDDFYRITAGYLKERLGDEAARETDEADRLGVINTADHHGALFCAQTFQGDLIFGELLSRLGYAGRHVPIHAGSQV